MKPKKLESQVVEMLQERHQDELDAFYFYRAASNWCKNVGYFKAAAFFAEESEDELTHAKKIENYLVDWNISPMLPTIPKAKTEFKSLVDVIQSAYTIEYDLYEAYEETSKEMFKVDICTFALTQELLGIQNKSVAEYSDKLNILEGVEATKINLLLIEKKLF